MALCERCKLPIGGKPAASQIGPIASEGAVSSTIHEMKRRARVDTDRELAAFLRRDQSAVSQWRRRGAIPEAIMLRFERLTAVKS